MLFVESEEQQALEVLGAVTDAFQDNVIMPLYQLERLFIGAPTSSLPPNNSPLDPVGAQRQLANTLEEEVMLAAALEAPVSATSAEAGPSRYPKRVRLDPEQPPPHEPEPAAPVPLPTLLPPQETTSRWTLEEFVERASAPTAWQSPLENQPPLPNINALCPPRGALPIRVPPAQDEGVHHFQAVEDLDSMHFVWPIHAFLSRAKQLALLNKDGNQGIPPNCKLTCNEHGRYTIGHKLKSARASAGYSLDLGRSQYIGKLDLSGSELYLVAPHDGKSL